MAQDIKTLVKEAKKDIEKAQNLKDLDDAFRVYLGRKGEFSRILKSLPELKKTERAKAGKAANNLKNTLTQFFDERKKALQTTSYPSTTLRASKLKTENWLDITLPSKKILAGHLHPLTLVQRQAEKIFRSMGFGVAQGPEVENDWYNFTALNMPEDHPARDMWDTFWLKPASAKLLLRTHTSPVQVRYMESHKPPLRIIAPGRVFRYEATDARHQINFYQLEGLIVGKEISIANFRAIIQEFFQRFFGKPVQIRLRPSYFPFTEPSFEVDITYDGGWMEIMGAGMVHPNVFKAVKYDPRKWKGFAFGIGIDRLAMMKYKIDDIRLFYSGDLRFLQQF